MSGSQKIAWPKANMIAMTFISTIQATCRRIEIAGSLRRLEAEVGDIEIVCVPKVTPITNMFGELTGTHSNLDAWLNTTIQLQSRNKWGEKYKQFQFMGMTVDLFITTPECWGVIYTIRTGPAGFSKRLVTQKRLGGLLPSNMNVKDGRIWIKGLALETPEEEDVFKAIGLDWIPPEDRE